MESDPVAVLPMRLNIDAFSDLVILKNGGEGALAVALTAPLKTITVNSTGDEANANCSAPPNICTLRRAIAELSSSNPPADAINFSVSSVTINPAFGELRQINYPITIDGGSNRVEIKGSGLTIFSANTVVRGLVINSTATSFRNGIVLDKLSFTTGGNCFIESNYIGTDAAGANIAVPFPSSATGISIGAVDNNTIGGTTPAARNLISGFTGAGVSFNTSSATGNKVQGNYIGTDSTGTKALANGYGVSSNLQTANVNTVGGTVAFARNIISGNRTGGVLAGANMIVQGNYIGTDVNGTNDVGNLSEGVRANGGNTQIGGTAGGAGNVIAFNKSVGVFVNIGTGTAVRRNSIFGNTSLAISGNGSNRPTLSGTTGTLTGATASTAFTIEFFTNDNCSTSAPQAKNYINGGDVTVTTNASGNATFNVPGGQFITATASAAGQNTSTSSNCVAGAPPTPTPTPTPTPALSDLELRTNPASPPPATIHIGQNATYSVVVTNNGPAKAFAVTVSGSLPANTVLDTGTANFCSANGAGTTFSCTLGDLDPAPVPHATSGTGVVVFNLALKPSTPGSITLSPTVSLDTSKSTDNVSSNNSVAIPISVVVDVTLLGFEVTQAVQDVQNSVPLVADKPTFIRAYVRADGESGNNIPVSATLVGTNSNGVNNGIIMPSNPAGKLKLSVTPRRAVLQDSFYFELPANWIKAGTLQFRIQSPDLHFTCSEPDGTPDCATSVTFRKMKKLSINFVGVTWKDASNVSHSPALDDLVETAGEIQARFPMYEFDTEISSTTITDNPCTVPLRTILDTIESLRTADISNGKATKKYYMGLLPDQSTCGDAFGSNGIAFNPGNSSLVFLTRNGIGGTGFGTPLMDGNSRAHELSHNTGIKHTSSGGGELSPAADYLPADGRISTGRTEYSADTAYGFDIYNSSSNRDGAQIFGPTTYDFMSYARPRWVSVFNYNKLFNSIGVDTGTNAIEADPNAFLVTQSVQVSGKISLSPETGTISPLFVKDTNASISLPVAGSYEMRLETASDS